MTLSSAQSLCYLKTPWPNYLSVICQPWREEYKYTVKNLQLDLFPRLGQQSAEIVTYLKLSTFKRLSHQVWQS